MPQAALINGITRQDVLLRVFPAVNSSVHIEVDGDVKLLVTYI